MFCREQAARFQARLGEFEEAGAEVVAIGPGLPLMVDEFIDRFSITFPVLTDPSREIFRRAGLKNKLGFRPSTLRHAARALAAGHRQGRTRGDPLQQGGIVVMSPEGELFRHVDGGPGDHCTLDEVLASLP